jgi:DNA polymerase III alpha subunit
MNRLQWEAARDKAKEEGKSFKKRSPKQTLPKNRIPSLFDAGAFDHHEDRALALGDQQNLEKELLGVILTDNCDEILENNWEEVEKCDSYPDFDIAGNDQIMYLPGIVSNINPKTTRKSGDKMGLITIEYQGDQVEFVVFPREWKHYKFLWKERTPGIFALSKSDRGPRFENALRLK